VSYQELEATLKSYERACEIRAHEHDESAESVRAERARHDAYNRGAPPHVRADQERAYERRIAEQVHGAAVSRRRAAYAKQGFMLSSPDESTDAEYQTTHGSLFRAMIQAGRVRFSERPAVDDAEPIESAELDDRTASGQ
jgi:hypothetical protein